MICDHSLERSFYVAMLPGPLFESLPPAALAQLDRTASLRSVGTNETLFHEEDRADLLILVLEGAVKVWRTSGRGTAITVHLFGSGALPGCAAVFRQLPYPASATATTATKVATWSAERIIGMMEAWPQLATNALGVVASHNQDMLERLHEVSTQQVEQRLARTVLRLIAGSGGQEGSVPEIELSRQALGELAATTLHTVSRFISRWERQGIVRAGRKRIGVLRPAALARICGGA